ncbi:MAG: hypothetical protein NUW37_05220 [Planctomycetes bacterium]|nr:hypothetical protein [Planctomycetota bacterium]
MSAINPGFSGRSGPGKLYLASPLTVAKSAFEGKIASAKSRSKLDRIADRLKFILLGRASK